MVLTDHEVNLIRNLGINQRTIQYFTGKYGNRFIRAVRAVEEGNVLLYRFEPSDTSRWIVRGSRRDYLVVPDIYCSCRSFYQDVVIAHRIDFCYHLLAQEIAELMDAFEVVTVSDTKRKVLLEHWRRTD